MKYIVTRYDSEYGRSISYYVKGTSTNSTWTSIREKATPLSWIKAHLMKRRLMKGRYYSESYDVEGVGKYGMAF